jgi:hypothetical protein
LKSKHNNGGNVGSVAGNGGRSTTALTFNEQREFGILSRSALKTRNVISYEQLNRQRVEAGHIAPIFSVSTYSTLTCGFVIAYLYVFVVFFVKFPA